MSLAETLLVQVFRSARSGKRPNLTAICRRTRKSVVDLERAFDLLEEHGLVTQGPSGESLTLAGLCAAAALARKARAHHRPLSSCRSIAA